MSGAKVSIIVPVYNSENYVVRCLDSIFRQTYADIEVICVDDGSTDNSLSVLKQYQSDHPQLRIIHRTNGGLSAARNTGLKNSIGKYVMFCDSDDTV